MRTLYVDIETTPNIVHAWGLWNQNVGLSQLIEPSRVMCFAAKWRGKGKVQFYSEFHDGRAAMLAAAHDLLSEADVVGHYNGTTFDVPHLNREFLGAGMAPPAPFQQLDFLRTVRRRFRFPSNKLAYVSETLEIGGKVKHEGHDLWRKCMEGQPTAWRKMRRYNRQDVALLESLHDRLMPWLPATPNARLYGDPDGCPRCGAPGEALGKRGFVYTATGAYQRYQCRQCGGWSSATRRDGGTNLRGVA